MQQDLITVTEHLNSVNFLLKSVIAVILLGYLVLYRSGPNYLVYTV